MNLISISSLIQKKILIFIFFTIINSTFLINAKNTQENKSKGQIKKFLNNFSLSKIKMKNKLFFFLFGQLNFLLKNEHNGKKLKFPILEKC